MKKILVDALEGDAGDPAEAARTSKKKNQRKLIVLLLSAARPTLVKISVNRCREWSLSCK